MGRSVGETVALQLEDTQAEWTIERIERGLSPRGRPDTISLRHQGDRD